MQCTMSNTLGNFDAQYEELATLSAIFPDGTLEFSPMECGDGSADIGWQGHLLIQPPISSPPGTLSASFSAHDDHDGTQSQSHGGSTTVITVESLPPVELHFSLPAGYPTAAVPHMQVLSDWAPFPLLEDLTAAADKAAQSCLAIESAALFDVYDALVQVLSKHVSSAMTVVTADGDATADSPGPSLQVDSREALQLILQHDQAYHVAKLANQPFTCLICLESHPGDIAVALPICQHRFCRTCITDFFTVLINEGMPKQVKCPHPDCSAPKPSSTPAAAPTPTLAPPPSNPPTAADVDEELASATKLFATHRIQPAFLLDLLGPDLTAKWTDRFLSRAYAADPGMHWCPVPACGGPARGHLDGTYVKLATCLRCQFSFCVHCSRAYHGSAQHCTLKNADEVVDEYDAAMELPGQAARDVRLAPLFAKYGRTVVETLARQREEAQVQEVYEAMVDKLQLVDLETRKWVRTHATACPKCGVRVIRSDGCAHMTCSICGESFCDHCGGVLEGGLVGSHYSIPGTPCFRKLYRN